jgi:16S rRNA (guanine527-N7)-methyltransferase
LNKNTLNKLKLYEESLKEWQQKFNLVSNSSLDHSWERHFEDSIQLFSLIPSSSKTLFDFGSGAGFPGMVLAVMAQEALPNLKVNLVESIKKKTLYLKHVSEILNVSVNIINDRIENIPAQKSDVITSRALSSLSELLNYSEKFLHKNTICIFPKGKKHMEEIADAQKKWKFDFQIHKSVSSDEGAILVLTNIRRK